MKTLLTILSLIVLCSCKKEYTCQCGNEKGVLETLTYKASNKYKKEAIRKCDWQNEYYQSTRTDNVTCALQ